MRTSSDFSTQIEQDGMFAKSISTLCSELGYDVVSSDEDWEDFRLDNEDGGVCVVSIDHYEDRVTVEAMESGEIVTRKEFSAEDGHTVDKVKMQLLL